MPVLNSAYDLIGVLKRGKLVPSQKMKRVLAELKHRQPDSLSASELANLLVRDRLLTQYQADQLLAGRHRSLCIGKYRLLEPIGSGGMGKVYRAEHIIMHRHVALKVLSGAMRSDPLAVARFLRESRAAAALNHPNIIRVYDIDQELDMHYLVMEYITGVSVDEFVRRLGPLPWDQAADFIRQGACGLQHAWQSGIVHRDIKPANLLIDSTGVIKILDMGLAVFHEDESEEASLTQMGNERLLGTADFLSPEQAINSHDVDIRTDVYSLGATFYYVLTGSPPFPSGSLAHKLLCHQTKEPRPIRDVRPEIPKELAEILSRMMGKQPDDRYLPDEIIELLAPFARSTPSPLENIGVEAPKPSFKRPGGTTISSRRSASRKPTVPAFAEAAPVNEPVDDFHAAILEATSSRLREPGNSPAPPAGSSLAGMATRISHARITTRSLWLFSALAVLLIVSAAFVLVTRRSTSLNPPAHSNVKAVLPSPANKGVPGKKALSATDGRE